MTIIVLGNTVNYSDQSSNSVNNILLNFLIKELFKNVNSPDHRCSVKVLSSVFNDSLTPDLQADLIKSTLINRINDGSLRVRWTGYDYIRSDAGSTVENVKIKFSTWDTDTENKITIDDSFIIPYLQYQEDIQNGVDGLIADIKQHLVDEFS